MRGPSFAEFAEQIFVRPEPVRDGLSRVSERRASAWRRLRPREHDPVSIRSQPREVIAVLKAAALLSFACLASSAVAAESPRCASLEKAQKDAGKDTAIAPLTPAQFHFLQGVYVLSPAAPDGLPPGDGALLLTHDHGDEGLILWTLGPLVCEPDAGTEEAHGLPRAGEIGRGRRRDVTAFAVAVSASRFEA